MAAQYCAYCGGALPAGSGFCPACGGAVAGAAGTPTPLASGPGPGAGYPTAPTTSWGGPYRPPAWAQPVGARSDADRARDVQALSHIRLASILALVSTVLGFLAVAIANLSGTFAVTTSSGTGGTTTNVQLPTLLPVYVGLLAVITVAQILLYRSGFKTLSVTSGEFSTPATLAIVALVGWLLLAVGLGVLLEALVQAINCTGSSALTGGTSCLLTGTFWGGLALVVVGAIVALVGFIGILIGIWRLGSRYDSALFKVAAILLIIPYVSLVGEILILAASTLEIGRARGH